MYVKILPLHHSFTKFIPSYLYELILSTSNSPKQILAQMHNFEKGSISTTPKRRLNPWLKWGLILLPITAIVGVVAWVLSMLYPADLLKMVPANSDIVVAIDGEQILEASGVDISIFGIEYSENFQELIDFYGNKKDGLLSNLMSAKCFDPRRIVFVTNVNKPSDSSLEVLLESYFLISLFNRDDAETILKDSNFKITCKDDYSISKVAYNTFIILNDDYCWLYKGNYCLDENIENENIILTENDVVNRIDCITNLASTSSISTDPHKRDILYNGSAIAACIDTKNFSEVINQKLTPILGENGINQEKIAISMRFDKMLFESEVSLYDKDWKQIAISPNSKKINESCAKWLNQKDLLSVAFTIDGDAPWADIIEHIESIIGINIPQLEREQLLTLLTSLDGTIMCACGINGIIQAVDKTANITSILEFKDGKANELFNLASEILHSIGAQNIIQEGSIIEAEINNNKIKMQEIDGKMIISNRRIEIKGNDVMNPEFFAENSFASIMYLDKDNFISRYLDLEGSILLATTCDNNKLSMKLNIQDIEKDNKSTGVIDFFIPSALKILNRF